MSYGMGGFDMMFSIFPVLFGIAFVVVVGIILVTAVKGVGQWHQNNQSPVLTVDARMVTKRSSTDVHHHSGTDTAMNHTTSSTSYYVTFEVTSGDRMEFHVSAQEYGMLVEEDQGKLTFQGTRYLGFERSR